MITQPIEAISTKLAPAALGPYSQGIKSGSLVFLSGQIPIDPTTGELLPPEIKGQTIQVMENLKQVLAAASLTFADVVKTTIFITDMANFAPINEIYAAYFTQPYPARSCVQISALPKNALIEIELIALSN